MNFEKFTKFCQRNVVMITGVGIIISFHLVWNQLQHSRLIPEDKRKELPIVEGARYLEHKVLDEIHHLKGVDIEGTVK